MSGILHTDVLLKVATAATPAVAASPPPAATNGAAHLAIASVAFDRSLLLRTVIEPSAPAAPNLPLLASRNGNVFAGSDNARHWYLPAFALQADVDAGFTFAATQSGQDAAGNPFYTASLTLHLRKSQPDDVAAFAKANPAAALSEIPLDALRAVLSSAYTDNDGKVQWRTLEGTVGDLGGGDILLTFAPILGPAVIGVYQDLVAFGKAQIDLSGTWKALAPHGVVSLPLPRFALAARTVLPPVAAAPRPPIAAMVRRIDVDDGDPRVAVRDPRRFVRVPPPSPSPPLLQTNQAWTASLPLALKYKQDGYQLKYTVSTGGGQARPIRDANDLRDFGRGGSEFVELKQLGAINLKYPSIGRAYYGVLSRSIVVIPNRYAIARSGGGCAAQCFAVVDSAPASASRSKFEFDFTLAPDISPIELLQFTHDVAQCAELAGYQNNIRLPRALQSGPLTVLQSSFVTQTQFSAGALDANAFKLAATVVDADAQAPAVAYANMLIAQLCPNQNNGAGLVGALDLQLDDAYVQPVPSPFVLNFARTAGGADEFTIRIDEGAGQLVLTNVSTLDLQLSRYAFIVNGTLSITPCTAQLAAGAALMLALPAEHAGLQFVVEAQLALADPLTKADVARLLSIKTVDVQQTQYVIAISAGGVDFSAVDSIRAVVTFDGLPGVSPPALTLTKDVHANSASVVVPIENAVFALPGTVQLTIKYADSSRADAKAVLQHDFTDQPVLVLDQSDIDKNLVTG